MLDVEISRKEERRGSRKTSFAQTKVCRVPMWIEPLLNGGSPEITVNSFFFCLNLEIMSLEFIKEREEVELATDSLTTPLCGQDQLEPAYENLIILVGPR